MNIVKEAIERRMMLRGERRSFVVFVCRPFYGKRSLMPPEDGEAVSPALAVKELLSWAIS
jgi:hypothetical protein